MAMLIFLYGKNIERMKAIYYFILYTVVGSFPFLINLLRIIYKKGSFLFSLTNKDIGEKGKGIISSIIFFF
jgi:formate hydrogenlyase subunit 3/multisubunit Na+/H+ antiporter MnhD subunit